MGQSTGMTLTDMADLDRRLAELGDKLDKNARGAHRDRTWRDFREKQIEIRQKLRAATGKPSNSAVVAGLEADYRILVSSFDRWISRQDKGGGL